MPATAHHQPLTPAQAWCLEHIPFTPEDVQPLTQNRAFELLEANRIALYQGIITQAEFDASCEDLAKELLA